MPFSISLDQCLVYVSRPPVPESEHGRSPATACRGLLHLQHCAHPAGTSFQARSDYKDIRAQHSLSEGAEPEENSLSKCNFYFCRPLKSLADVHFKGRKQFDGVKLQIKVLESDISIEDNHCIQANRGHLDRVELTIRRHSFKPPLLFPKSNLVCLTIV